MKQKLPETDSLCFSWERFDPLLFPYFFGIYICKGLDHKLVIMLNVNNVKRYERGTRGQVPNHWDMGVGHGDRFLVPLLFLIYNSAEVIRMHLRDKEAKLEWIRYDLREPKTTPTLTKKYTRNVVYFF